jgi:hypothetical protein
MRKSLLFGIFLLVGWIEPAKADWWDKYPQPSHWEEGREQLKKDLLGSLRNKKAAGLNPDEADEDRFRLWQWMGNWSFLNEGADVEAFRELGRNAELRRDFFENLDPEDNRQAALRILIRLQKEASAEVRELPALAVALAIVFDQPFPDDWPHDQTGKASIPKEEVDVVVRIKEVVEDQRKSAYITNLKDYKVGELKYIIDHPLKHSELEWARKTIRNSLINFKGIYSGIHYDFSRLKAPPHLNWPGSTYSLEQIKSKGGICVDQAYFTAMVGKSKGVPTLFFTGLGDVAGHAWVGYMDSPGNWKTDCGGGVNEVVGRARDPQTWKSISDSEFDFFSKRNERSIGYRRAQFLTDLDTAFPDEHIDDWANLALKTKQDYLPAWRLLGLRMASNNIDNEKQMIFWKEFVNRFSKYPEIESEGLGKLIELANMKGDEKMEESLRKQLVKRNKGNRFDISIAAAYESLAAKCALGDWEGAESAYKRILVEFKNDMGLPVFADLINPFVELAVQNGQSDLAKRAVQNGRRAFKEALGSPAKGSAKYDLMLMLDDNFTKLDELLKKKSAIH